MNYNIWMKNRNMKNKSTEMALVDHHIVNDVTTTDELPDLFIYLQGVSRSRTPSFEPPYTTSAPLSSSTEEPMQ